MRKLLLKKSNVSWYNSDIGAFLVAFVTCLVGSGHPVPDTCRGRESSNVTHSPRRLHV